MEPHAQARGPACFAAPLEIAKRFQGRSPGPPLLSCESKKGGHGAKQSLRGPAGIDLLRRAKQIGRGTTKTHEVPSTLPRGAEPRTIPPFGGTGAWVNCTLFTVNFLTLYSGKVAMWTSRKPASRQRSHSSMSFST